MSYFRKFHWQATGLTFVIIDTDRWVSSGEPYPTYVHRYQTVPWPTRFQAVPPREY